MIIQNFIKSFTILLVSLFVIYYVGGTISKVYFLALLFVVWRSKNEYFWTAIVFIMLNTPGGFFSDTSRTNTVGLPLYSIGPISFSFIQLFSLLLLSKALMHRRFVFLFKKEYILGLSFFILLIIVSFAIGVDLSGVITIYAFAIGLTLYYSFFFVFREEQYILKFFEIIFPYVFVAIGLQAFGLYNESPLISLVDPDRTGTGIWGAGNEEFKRPIEMTSLLLLSAFGSLYLFVSKRFNVNKIYLILVIGGSSLAIFLTGTRSWFLAYVVLILLYIVNNSGEIAKSAKYIVIGLTFLVIWVGFSNTISDQIGNAMSRISTIQGAVGGEEKFKRVDERLPKVLKGIDKSTIIVGAGFSDIYTKYSDSHVGYFNNFLVSGVIGFLFYIYFLGSMYIKSINIVKKQKSLVTTKEITNICISMAAIFVLNTATQFGGVSLKHYYRIFVLAFIFAWLNAVVSSSLQGTKYSN